MRILMIGGTGTISGAVLEQLYETHEHELTVINRGNHPVPEGVEEILCDVKDEEKFEELLKGRTFDVIVDVLVYEPAMASDRIRFLKGKCGQYVFISTEVVVDHESSMYIDSSSLTGNRYSTYGGKKEACEKLFLQGYEEGFPVTIVRPGQTYSKGRMALSVKGKSYWSVVSRIKRGKPVIVHGDGKGIWHFMHADDFARLFIPLLGRQETLGKIFHIIHPEMMTWDMIYRTIAEYYDKEIDICHIPSDLLAKCTHYDFKDAILGDKQYSNIYSLEELKPYVHDLTCRISCQQGIEMFLEYLESHPEEQKEDPSFDVWCDLLIKNYRAYTESVEMLF